MNIHIPYKIGRQLGKGGMADVYEAENQDAEQIAVKVFRNEKESRFLHERFIAEAKLLKTLYHPRIVRVHDFGIDGETGRAWYVMDLVLGADGKAQTLADIGRAACPQAAETVPGLLRSHDENGRAACPQAADGQLRMWFAEIKDALDYLHKCGVVHRDVKLENILIDNDGHAKLADFGVSRIVDEGLRREVGSSTTFVTGETTGMRPVMGTYFYLPPDIRAGAPATPESDFYALGVVFFRLLTRIWYEPGTNAADLLAPFPDFWRQELGALLESPRRSRSNRVTTMKMAERLVPKPPRNLGRRSFIWLCALSLAATSAFLAVFMLRREDPIAPNPSTWSFPKSFTTPLVKSLPLGDGAAMDFCACPAGTFMMSNLDKTTCHKVTITRPFWIAAAPITARQLRLEFPDAARDEIAMKMERAFTNMIVACKMQGGIVRDYIQRLNMRYGKELPPGYVFRLPTEAELEYAIREGGTKIPETCDVWCDNAETKSLLAATGIPLRRDLRLLPKAASKSHALGLVTLWTDTEQAVLDSVDGRAGTKTASTAIAYAMEETDPLRTGALQLSRQFCFQRWLLMKEPSGFIRICIGPNITPTTVDRSPRADCGGLGTSRPTMP